MTGFIIFLLGSNQDECKHTRTRGHTHDAHGRTLGGWLSSLPCPLPSPCPSLSQMYFIINQSVAHLPACCFFPPLSIKHLLLLVLSVTLRAASPSFWGCRPWRTCLDYCTSAQSTGCYQTRALSQTPRSRHAATEREEDAAGPRRKQKNGPRNTRTDCTGQGLEKSMYVSVEAEDNEPEANQTGKLKSGDKCSLQLHHKRGNYGVLQNRGQTA